MGITVYSVAISIVFYNLALIAVFILRRSPGVRAKHAVSLLAFITVLGVVRLVLPIDFDAAYVVRSYKIIPAVEDFLRRPLAAPFTYGHLLLTLWAVGSLVMVIKDVRLQRRFDRYLQSIDFVDRPELLEIAAEYGSSFAVLISPQLHMPFTSGILHPVIYLPDVELSDAEWRMVFRHEITHIRSRDNLKKLFFLAVEALFWWNPLAHFSSKEINTLLELRCDVKVISDMNDWERVEYVELLKKLLILVSFQKLPTGVSSILGDSGEMHSRFTTLEMYEKRAHRTYYDIFAALGLLFLLSYFILLQPARRPSAEDVYTRVSNPKSFVSENEDSYSVSGYIVLEEDGKYSLYIDGHAVGFLSDEAVSFPPWNLLPIIKRGA